MRIGLISSGLLAILLICSAAAARLAAPAALPIAPEPLVTISTLRPGVSAPDFSLADTKGDKHSISDLTTAGKVVVLEWFSPDCPEVAKYRSESTFMNDTAAHFSDQQLAWLAIDSEAVGKDGKTDNAAIEQFAKDHKLPPVLLDRDGTIGHKYGVTTTPTVFVINRHGTVVYSGAPDASTALDNKPSETNYLRSAISAAVLDKQPLTGQTLAVGCSIDFAPAKPVTSLVTIPLPKPAPRTRPPARPMPQR